jgi:hypothetical protein
MTVENLGKRRLLNEIAHLVIEARENEPQSEHLCCDLLDCLTKAMEKNPTLTHLDVQRAVTTVASIIVAIEKHHETNG